jgi:hypothetical protein
MKKLSFQETGIALLLAVLSGCANDQAIVNSKTEAKTNITFIDINKFDAELSASLAGKSEPISVSFYEKVSPNAMPERLQKWLTTVERTGGKVDIESPPNELAPKNPMILISLFSGLWSGMKSFNEVRDSQVVNAAKGRSAVISLERNPEKQLVVSKVTFVQTAK